MFRLLQPYFGHFSCVSFGYVCNMQSSRSAYNLNQSVVEKLLSFVKLVLRGGTAPLQIETGRYTISAFLVRFVVSLILHICPWRVPIGFARIAKKYM